MLRWVCCALIGLSLAALPDRPAAAQELAARSELRVCADPNSLPFSNDRLEGFENQLARWIAEELKLPLRWVWWPQVIGFVRNTLNAGLCDLVMGTASGEELMQNTNAYYRSAYALVYRRSMRLKPNTLSDPALPLLRIGVVEATPPATALARYGIPIAKPYQLNTDSRVHQPARDALADVAAGVIDAAIIWGPIAGYYADRLAVPLAVVPLAREQGPFRLVFRITMGVRADEPEWRRWLNRFIKRRQGDIDRLLASYHVPLYDEAGNPIAPPASVEVPPDRPAPEKAGPDGYRIDHLEAPLPAAVPGARTVATDEVRRLHGTGSAVLVDVLPRPVRPPDLPAGSVWTPKRHRSLPGATWLANVGFGALTPQLDAYFRDNLRQLSHGDKAATIVIFCLPDCWMSWNAAKRAVSYGYTGILWYPDGIDAWAAAGLPLTEADPVPLAPSN